MGEKLVMKGLKIWGLALILILSACSKKEDTPPPAKTGVELVAIGPINFGGLLVGDYRDAAIRIYNYGPDAIDTTNLTAKLTDPFFVQSIAAPCSTGSLASGQNCVVAIRFRPQLPGTYSQDFVLGNSKITTTGRGLVGGVMELSATHWDIGQTVAGVETRKTFTVSNLGDFTIPAPQLTLVPGITLGFNDCGSFIATQNSCHMELVAKKTVAGFTNEFIVFNAQDGGSISVSVENTVIPAAPAGTISFVETNIALNGIVADGTSQYTVHTNPIKDQYGNIVTDGTSVRLSGSNVTLITPSPQNTNQGVVTFTFQSPTVRGYSTISLLSADANGFLRALAHAGPAVGAINVQAYTSPVIANGQTQVHFVLQPLKDQFGNVVEDDTPVYYELQGPGSITKTFGFTRFGIDDLYVTSGTQVASATLHIYSNTAEGFFPISYIPGNAAGTIPITASEPAIYAYEDQSFEDQGIPIRTTITVGPVRDAYGNVVAQNTPLQLSVDGGRNVTYQNPTYPVTTYTDGAGQFQFILAGNDVRGYITITVTGGANASGTYKVWAFTDTRLTPSNNSLDNKFTVYETYNSATVLPDLTKRWASFGANDLSSLSLNDGVPFKILERTTSTINSFLSSADYLNSPCWFARADQVQIGPCSRDRFLSKASITYPATNTFTSDGGGPNHRPLMTVKNNHNVNVSQGAYQVGQHDPGTRGGWDNIYGSPILPSIGFLPGDNSYVVFGGLFNDDAIGDYCPRISTTFNDGNAPNECNARLSCAWDSTNQVCRYKSSTSFIGYTTDYASIYFNLDQVNQSTASTFEYSGMDFEQIGDYPQAAANMSMTNDGNKTLYTFGGFQNISGGQAFNQVYSYNADSRRWTQIWAEGDPNERGANSEPSPRYQNSLAYVKETNSLYVAGGLRHYSCDEFITKGTCHQYAACTWNDYDSIDCNPFNTDCSVRLDETDNLMGEFCESVTSSSCDDINSFNYKNQAQTECVKRPSCQWNALGQFCALKDGADTSGQGWTDAKDMWQLDLTPLSSGDPNAFPVWKKLCNSQEPFLNGNPNSPNPAFRDCGLPGGSAGQPAIYPDLSLTSNIINMLSPPLINYTTHRMNMIWNPMRQKMYLTWDGLSNILSYDPYTDAFATPSGAATGLANSYQVFFSPYTARMFAYKRGGINQSNSTLMSWESDPHEKRYVRAEIDLGLGAKQYASTLKPIVRASGGSYNPPASTAGVIAYIFNYSNNQWELIGSNTLTGYQTSAQTYAGAEIAHEYIGTSSQDYISNDGKVNILVTPQGDPADGGYYELYIESIALEGRF